MRDKKEEEERKKKREREIEWRKWTTHLGAPGRSDPHPAFTNSLTNMMNDF